MNDIDKSRVVTKLREIVGRINDPVSRDEAGKPSTYELEQVAHRAQECIEILLDKRAS